MRLAGAIRSAIRDGRLPLGAALPPSRALASDLDVSRWTVTQAYGQLATEGYLTARTGSATRVGWTPDASDDHGRPPGRQPAATRAQPVRYNLCSCHPDLRAFPRRKWVAAITAAAATASFDQFDYPEPGGLPELRQVLSEHLTRSRGAIADPATLSVFSGAGQALIQLCRALQAEGQTTLAIEDPGSVRYRQAALTTGMELIGLPVDERGLVVGSLDQHPDLRAVCVGIARQMTYGHPLPPDRRRQLLDWAGRVDGLVIEDDYDSEFSYERPAPSVLQGADPRRVALLGSMSQALGPTISIGWVVAPGRLVQAVRAEEEIQLLPPALNQLALVQLMQSGAYDRHLRTTRLQLKRRRNALAESLRRRLPAYRVYGTDSGMQLMLELPGGSEPAAIVTAARQQGLLLGDLDEMRLSPDPARPGLLLGYGNLPDTAVDDAVAALAEVLRAAA